MARRLSEEIDEGLAKPAKKITGKDVRAAVESLVALREKISSPTGEKGAEVKKLRDGGLNMDAVNLLVKMSGWSEEKLASFYETFTPGVAEMKLGPPKDLFTGNGADEANANKKRARVREAVNGDAATEH